MTDDLRISQNGKKHRIHIYRLDDVTRVTIERLTDGGYRIANYNPTLASWVRLCRALGYII